MALVSFGVRAWYFSKPRSGFAVPGPWFASELSRFWLPSYLDWFALGMGMALVSAWCALDGRLPRAIAWFGHHAGWSWGVALGCYWAMTEFGIDPIGPDSLRTQGEVAIRWAMTGLAAAFFVLPAVFGPQSRGVVRVPTPDPSPRRGWRRLLRDLPLASAALDPGRGLASPRHADGGADGRGVRVDPRGRHRKLASPRTPDHPVGVSACSWIVCTVAPMM